MLYPLHFLLFLLYADIEPPKLILYFSNLFTIFHFFLFLGVLPQLCLPNLLIVFISTIVLLKNISFSSSFCCCVNVYFRRIRLLFHECSTFFSHSEVINASPSSSSLLSFSSSSSSPPLLLLLFSTESLFPASCVFSAYWVWSLLR